MFASYFLKLFYVLKNNMFGSQFFFLFKKTQKTNKTLNLDNKNLFFIENQNCVLCVFKNYSLKNMNQTNPKSSLKLEITKTR